MDSDRDTLTIRPFCVTDQDAAKRLILEGMEEHWGFIDPAKNPDLDQIGASYANDTFVVACQGSQFVGTGALIAEDAHVGRIVRMSVARRCRRLGIGSKILQHLCERAVANGYQRIVLETTSSWTDAVDFYTARGFEATHCDGGDTHFILELNG